MTQKMYHHAREPASVPRLLQWSHPGIGSDRGRCVAALRMQLESASAHLAAALTKLMSFVRPFDWRTCAACQKKWGGSWQNQRLAAPLNPCPHLPVLSRVLGEQKPRPPGAPFNTQPFQRAGPSRTLPIRSVAVAEGLQAKSREQGATTSKLWVSGATRPAVR